MKFLHLFVIFFLSFSQIKKNKIAIIDTNFCPKEYKYLQIIDHTPEKRKLKTGCNTHGQIVLDLLASKIDSYQEVHLFSVFDSGGQQLESYWEQALNRYNKLFFDHTLIAVGTDLPLNMRVISEFLKSPSPKYVASGQISKGLNSGENLFPQKYYKNEKIVLVGGYFKTLKDKKLIPKHQFFAGKIEEFQEIDTTLKLLGSSQAALTALIQRIQVLPDISDTVRKDSK